VLTPVTHAGVLALELHTRVRPLDLGLLLAHPHLVVGMQLTKPHRCAVAVRTLLGNAQPATPERLHAVIFCVLNEVLELGAADTLLGLQVDRAELGRAVLEQLGSGHRCWYSRRCIWALTRQTQRGRCRYWSNRSQLGRNGLADGVEVEPVTLGQQLDLLGFTILPRPVIVLLEVKRVRDAQNSGGVRRHSHIDVELLLLAQALQVLGSGLPHSHIDVFGERPVAVQPAAREHDPRSTKRVQASIGKERTKRQCSLLLGGVAVHVDKQRLDEACVLRSALACCLKRSQREVNVLLRFDPAVYGRCDLFQSVDIYVLLFVFAESCRTVNPCSRGRQNNRKEFKRGH